MSSGSQSMGAGATTVAVVGCGYWGKNLVRNFNELGALRMVCDPAPVQQALARQLAPEATVVSGLADVLASDVAGVVIATPAATHYEVAKAALEAGKDVLVEKPLALTYEDGEALVHEAERTGRVLMVGHVLEYHPAITKLREIVGSGALGDVLYVYSNRISLGKVRREENILWSFAPHDIAVILRVLGSTPSEVSACGGSYLQPEVADVTVTNMLFPGGVRAHIHVSWLHPFKEQRLVIIGSRRMLSFDDVSKKLVLYDQRVEINGEEATVISRAGEDVPFAGDEPLRVECQAFLDSMADRTQPLTDGDSGLRVLRVLRAAQESLERNGQPVKIEAVPDQAPARSQGRGA